MLSQRTKRITPVGSSGRFTREGGDSAQTPTAPAPRENEAVYGAFIPQVWGSGRVGGTVIWADELAEGDEEETAGSYTRSLAVLICHCPHRPIEGISHIWGDDKLIYENGQSEFTFRFYLGTDDQEPDPLIESIEGEGNVPGYRRQAYVVWEKPRFDLWGGKRPALSFKIAPGSAAYTDTKKIAVLGGNTPLIDLINGAGDGYTAQAITAEEIEAGALGDGGFSCLVSTRPAGGSNVPISGGAAEALIAWVKPENGAVGARVLLNGDFADALTAQTFDFETIQDDVIAQLYLKSVRYASASGHGYVAELAAAAAALTSNADGYEPLDLVSGAAGPIIFGGGGSNSSLFPGSGAGNYPTFADLALPYNPTPGTIESVEIGAEITGVDPAFVAAGWFAGFDWVTDEMILKPAVIAAPAVIGSGGGAVGVSLQTILEDVSEQCGLEGERRDYSAAAGVLVDSFPIDQLREARASLDPLLRHYAVDLAEPDGKIVAIPRGGEVAATLTAEELGARAGGEMNEASPRVEVVRVQDVELPGALAVQYRDIDRHFAEGEQRARHLTAANARNTESVSLPLGLTAAAARQGAERMLWQAWTEREQYGVSLLPRRWALAPGSIVNLPVGDALRRARLVSVDYGLFAEMRCQAVRDDPRVLVQDAAGGEMPERAPLLIKAGETTLLLWNGNATSPALQALDVPLLYIAATGDAAWPGCFVYLSRDGGATGTLIGEINAPATVGTVLTELAPSTVGTALFETAATVDVDIAAGRVPTSRGQAEVLVGANRAFVGGELIHFQSVSEIGPGQYRIGNLLRGQKGTDGAWGEHEIGERFVMLGRGVLAWEVPADLLGKQVHLYAKTKRTLEQSPTVAVTVSGANLRPYAPAHVSGSRDESGNLTISWQRRERKGANPLSGVPATLGEAAEAYAVEVMVGGLVVRTMTGLTTPGAVYGAGEQSADGIALFAPVTVRVRQIGAGGIDGYAAEVTI